MARGEFPAWLDIDAVAGGIGALLDGVILQSIEEGAGYRRSVAERRVLSMIELMLAAASAAPPERLEAVRPQPYGAAEPVAS